MPLHHNRAAGIAEPALRGRGVGGIDLMPADFERRTGTDAAAQRSGEQLAAQAMPDHRQAALKRQAHQRQLGADVIEVFVIGAHRAAEHAQTGIALKVDRHGVAGMHLYQSHRSAARGQPLAEMTGTIAFGMLDDQHRLHRADLGAGSGTGDADEGSLDDDDDDEAGAPSAGNRSGGTTRKRCGSISLAMRSGSRGSPPRGAIHPLNQARASRFATTRAPIRYFMQAVYDRGRLAPAVSSPP